MRATDPRLAAGELTGSPSDQDNQSLSEVPSTRQPSSAQIANPDAGPRLSTGQTDFSKSMKKTTAAVLAAVWKLYRPIGSGGATFCLSSRRWKASPIACQLVTRPTSDSSNLYPCLSPQAAMIRSETALNRAPSARSGSGLAGVVGQARIPTAGAGVAAREREILCNGRVRGRRRQPPHVPEGRVRGVAVGVVIGIVEALHIQVVGVQDEPGHQVRPVEYVDEEVVPGVGFGGIHRRPRAVSVDCPATDSAADIFDHLLVAGLALADVPGDVTRVVDREGFRGTEGAEQGQAQREQHRADGCDGRSAVSAPRGGLPTAISVLMCFSLCAMALEQFCSSRVPAPFCPVGDANDPPARGG